MSGNEAARKLYLIDGTAQLFRAYFAVSGLTNSEGLPTNAVYGFTSMLRKLLREEQPPYVAVAFDLAGPVFRHERFAEYKANRPPTPEDLNVQVPYAKEICEAMGVPIVELAGYEADDLIATYTTRAREDGFEVVIVAADKDLLQLVEDGVTVLNPAKNLRLDATGVEEGFGVPPDRVRDVLGLMGDSVDNVPGVPGVGRKTALSVVATYGDLEAVIRRAERFVAAYDARDDLVRAIDAAAKEKLLQEPTASALLEAAERFRTALDALVGGEPDGGAGEPLRAVRDLLQRSELSSLGSRVGEPGRKATKALGPLKRELKGMDRGSSRRVWYAIGEHAEQARLSKELVTLDHAVPAERGLEELRLASPDAPKVRSLFESLDFTTFLDDPAGAAAKTVESDRSAEGPSALAVLDREDLEHFIDGCRSAGRLAIGVTVENGHPMRVPLLGLAISCRAGAGAYVPIGHRAPGAAKQLSVESVRELLAPLFADAEVAKVGHDLKTSAHVLAHHGMPVSGWTFDTMVAAFLLNPGRSAYAIDGLAREFLGEEPAPLEGTADSGAAQQSFDEIEIERYTPWAAGRAEAILRLADRLDERLEEAGLLELYRTIDGPLLPLLVRMESRGIRVDTALLQRMSGEMQRAIDAARAEIHALAGVEFNVDSPKQLREVLFERLGLRPRRKTAKSRAASTDAQTLEELAGEHAIAHKILEYRELAKLRGTYVDRLPALVRPETGRVHTSFHPTGAATGRLSSSDPNLQNIPVRTEAGRKIRAAFVPADGCVFLASDYSQIELRILAHLTGDPELVAAFRAGEDIHRHTAATVFGVIADLVTDEMRRRAKAVNFGILYGMSETRLAREQGMTRKDAHRFIEAYFERFGKVREYIDAVREQAKRDAAVRTLFGRIRLFPQLHQQSNRAVQEQALRAAVNTTLQGTAADLMKLAMLRVDEEIRAARSEAQVLLQVHDELLIELPEGEVDAAVPLVRRAMEQVHSLEVPLVVDQKVGKSWMDVT